MVTFYARFVGDDEYRCEFAADDYEKAMLCADAFCRALEFICQSEYVVYVSPVPFDD